MSEVYLYDDRLLIYYNINKNHPELAKSDLALLESDGFDQRAAAILVADRILGAGFDGRSVSSVKWILREHPLFQRRLCCIGVAVMSKQHRGCQEILS